jgi:Lrp/AsnC family leucine-responsive transcriptional regulator
VREFPRLDATDLGLLGRLARDGRASWVDLAREFRLTPPAIAARVRRLVEGGVVRQFTALVEARAVGALTAFVEVTFDGPSGHDEFRQAVGRLVAVQECHRIAGGAHFLVKVRARSTEELDHFLSAVLPQAARGATCRASMVLSTIKETAVYPLPRT